MAGTRTISCCVAVGLCLLCLLKTCCRVYIVLIDLNALVNWDVYVDIEITDEASNQIKDQTKYFR